MEHDSGTGGHADGGAMSEDSSRPEVDSSECVMDSGACVVCDDNNWHCDDLVLPPCPPGLDPHGSCTGAVDGGLCMTCASDGGGTEWRCLGGAHWVTNPGLSCSP
jgi:hypothetical protein